MSDDAAKIRVSEYPTSTTGQSVVIEREGRRTQGAAQVTTDDLIARLEKAEAGSRELDAAVSRSLGSRPEYEKDGFPHWSDCALHNEPALPAGPCDCGGWCPTSSIDAALTLTNGLDIDSYELFNDCGSWFIKFSTLVDGGHYVETRNEAGWGDGALVFCCILFKHLAALKARTQGDGDE